ncbi:NB-ARC domain-containing protein [Micromonospora sp. NPDC048871]|uniref:NB-ARC domain-containing protein n=1 Tax=Micromonospora sp. NPDC048871 TaxID=3364259 RepID=UPI00371ED9D3
MQVAPEAPQVNFRLTRMRMFALIDAFERDMRDILARYVLTEISPEEAFGGAFERAREKQLREPETEPGKYQIVEFLDFKEAYDLLNRNRVHLPEGLAREIRQLASNMDRLVTIRNRVMHGRPIGAGDPEVLPRLLGMFQSTQWRSLSDAWVHLESDPFWEPRGEPNPSDYGLALHNLPLPDYDETGLIGREADVDRLLAMCKRGRESVITVTGEGGIGKTALALEIAYKLVDDSDRPYDAVLWCSLKTERLTAEGVRQIAQAVTSLTGAVEALSAAVDPGVKTYEQLAYLLDGVNALIVIDNLETVNSTTFIDMYEALPSTVRFLVTSRVGVGEVERRYPLTALSERDSMRLLSDLINYRRVASLQRISTNARCEVVKKLRCSPLAVKWFVLAVEAGREPLTLIRNQGELLDFCVRSVYEALSADAKEALLALFALGRPVASDDLVLITGRAVDDISRAVKELTRGSLVNVAPRRDSDGLFEIGISESASQFMRHADLANSAFANEIARRDEEYRVDEERRAREASSRTLAPIVVRTRNSGDTATAQLLRRALLASQNENYDEAYRLIKQARSLNHDFWELDRVEGFVRAAQGQHAVATQLYKNAYRLAQGEHRAIVAHFLAGHLSRNLKDVDAAFAYSQEAHKVLRTSETAVALGNQMVWLQQFEDGISLIEPAIGSSTGRGKLIAVTSLVEARRRFAEYLRDADRSPLAAFDQAWLGVETAIPYLLEGIVDRRLVAACSDSAAIGIYCLLSALGNGVALPESVEGRLTPIVPLISRLMRSDRGGQLMHALERVSRHRESPTALLEAKEHAAAWNRAVRVGETDLLPEYVGRICSIPGPTYGFIAHEEFPGNLFFHRDDCVPEMRFASLFEGELVRFRVEVRDNKFRAVQVSRVQPPG